MNKIGTNVIETERLILRKIKASDYEDVYNNWASDKLVARYVTWDVHESKEITKKYCQYKENRYNENDYCYDWLITLKENKTPIGEIEAVKVSLNSKLVEVGYCLGSKYWNLGYATEALKAFIKYMFDKVNVEKIIACHMSSNMASGKVMQKCDMKYDGTLKGYVIDKNINQRVDLIYYSIDKVNR